MPLTDADHATLKQSLEAIERRIAEACQRSNRDRGEVSLIAVTKYGGPALCESLVRLGALDLGENRVAHLNAVARRLGENSPARWHMIGHLQRNKVRKLEAELALLHSLDSLKLAGELQKRLERPLAVLVQVNTSAEEQKDGLEPERLGPFLDELRGFDKLHVRGLMTMAALGDPERARPCFRLLRELRDEQRGRGFERLSDLSMGMSADFEVAIEEGATLVRVGRVLYESLTGLDNDRASIEAS